jgi:hypothetical protein
MRSDMGRLIIERPRNGHRGRYRMIGSRNWDHNSAKNPIEEALRREPMGRNGTKDFTDHLSPLFRFLDKQVGRPWDRVWSEISRWCRRRAAARALAFGRRSLSVDRWTRSTQCTGLLVPGTLRAPHHRR